MAGQVVAVPKEPRLAVALAPDGGPVPAEPEFGRGGELHLVVLARQIVVQPGAVRTSSALHPVYLPPAVPVVVAPPRPGGVGSKLGSSFPQLVNMDFLEIWHKGNT